LTHNPSTTTVEPENGGYLGDVGQHALLGVALYRSPDGAIARVSVDRGHRSAGLRL
jgi:hypothetical protein